MNTDWLPSKTVIAFVLIPLLTIFAIWMIGQLQSERSAKQAKQELAFVETLNSAVNAYNERDSDGDLLKDWEEFLYNTRIDKKDTDGDGLDDYSEVLDPLRDPTVPDAHRGRPQAQSESNIDVIGDDPYYVYDDSLNTTEKFSRDVLNTFAQLQGSGSINTGVQEQLLKKVSESVDQREQKQAEYTIEDIKIASSNSTQAIASYRKGFEKATRVLRGVKEQDLLLLAKYAETKDPSKLDELKRNAEAYLQFINELKEVPVPPEVANVHLEFLNNLYIMQENIRDMSEPVEDPLGALIAAGDYSVDEEVLGTNIKALSLYFNNN
ncbi:MAG: hypothetical protein ACKKL4_03055 [Patescibacteria group bacterium]